MHFTLSENQCIFHTLGYACKNIIDLQEFESETEQRTHHDDSVHDIPEKDLKFRKIFN